MDEIVITALSAPSRMVGLVPRRRVMLGAGLGVGAGLLGMGRARAQDAQNGPTPQASAPDAAATPDNGQAEIVVDHARNDPIPIGLPSLGGGLGAQIMSVVTNDLANCGLFKPVGGPGASADPPEAPNFAAWKALGAQALVTGTAGEGSSARVEFRLWDVLAGQQLQGTAYSTSAGNWRRIAHIMADVIYERMLGEKGYFDTRVAYIAGTGPRDRRVKRLAIMDQDGANGRILTDGQWLALTPRFHPTRDEVVFMSYQNNKPRVFLFDLGSGRQSVLGEFQGMSFAPRFAPDGGSVVMSVARDAGSDIVAVDLGSRRERRLTSSGSIDTSPCYSPDGSQIVFNSDRGGDQQLYVMDAGGGGARRISFGSGRYATPVWSPRGDLIAFTRLGGASWAIGVMKPDGSGERILSESYQVEAPTFCPNGRVLMFERQSAASGSRGEGFSSHLVSIDITGFNERSVPTSTDATDPAWSPLNA